MENRGIILCERCQHHIDTQFHPIDPILLHSSHVPSQEQVTKTSDLLEQESQLLHQYESTIRHQRHTLERLEVAKSRLEAIILKRRSTISIHRRVPVEVWRTIFLLACSKDGYFLTIDPPNRQARHRTALLQVCSRWRSIVIGCPEIWSAINVNLLGERYISMGDRMLVETFLANGAASPLTLHVTVRSAQHWAKNSLATWELLTRHFPRCEWLSLKLDDYTILSRYQGPHFTFHSLSSFYFDAALIPSSHPMDWDSPFWRALRHAPKLTKVYLPEPRKLPRNSLPYLRLTTLVIGFTDVDDAAELLQVLELSRSLRSFTLSQVQDLGSGNFDHIIRRVEMPSLQSLSFCVDGALPKMDNPILTILFSSLTMPVLSTFKLACARAFHNPTQWYPPLLAMLQRSSTALRHMSLFIHPVHCQKDAWEPLSILLETTPHLSYLEFGGKWKANILLFDGTPLPDSFISATVGDFIYTPQNAVLPNLKQISFVGIRLDPETLANVFALASSRSPSRLSSTVDDVRALTDLRVFYYAPQANPDLKPHTVEEIRRLGQEGVKILLATDK
ncbi:hypothetical protein E1B28_003493 [Marasmius oreades]|uniref:F-box domain-containing protein n=1 Tax=Marasmius oreades TaxID=181124 RepID=A0A9P7UKP2_9AGAR|nr:uncharacterized protein E1B28_003493 [Marasmius oreades]KAG7085968.1 hypothetical protein E1B28_003493 [Marasmius oreades]